MLNPLVFLVVVMTSAPFEVEVYDLPTLRLCQDAEMVHRIVHQPNQYQYACELVTEDPAIDPRLRYVFD